MSSALMPLMRRGRKFGEKNGNSFSFRRRTFHTRRRVPPFKPPSSPPSSPLEAPLKPPFKPPFKPFDPSSPSPPFPRPLKTPR